jgi:hypothetical protein
LSCPSYPRQTLREIASGDQGDNLFQKKKKKKKRENEQVFEEENNLKIRCCKKKTAPTCRKNTRKKRDETLFNDFQEYPKLFRLVQFPHANYR